MPWHVEGRINARYHVQVELLRVPEVERTPAEVEVAARVMRVFRGADELQPGAEIRFLVAVYRDGDDRQYGVPWLLLAKLKGAKFMEAFLDGKLPRCEVCNRQIGVIFSLTDAPSMRVPSQEELDCLPLVPLKTPIDTTNVI